MPALWCEWVGHEGGSGDPAESSLDQGQTCPHLLHFPRAETCPVTCPPVHPACSPPLLPQPPAVVRAGQWGAPVGTPLPPPRLRTRGQSPRWPPASPAHTGGWEEAGPGCPDQGGHRGDSQQLPRATTWLLRGTSSTPGASPAQVGRPSGPRGWTRGVWPAHSRACLTLGQESPASPASCLSNEAVGRTALRSNAAELWGRRALGHPRACLLGLEVWRPWRAGGDAGRRRSPLWPMRGRLAWPLKSRSQAVRARGPGGCRAQGSAAEVQP